MFSTTVIPSESCYSPLAPGPPSTNPFIPAAITSAWRLSNVIGWWSFRLFSLPVAEAGLTSLSVSRSSAMSGMVFPGQVSVVSF